MRVCACVCVCVRVCACVCVCVCVIMCHGRQELCVCGNSGVTYLGNKRLSQGLVWISLLSPQGWCVNSGQWSSLSRTSCPLSQPELHSRGTGLSSPISFSDAFSGVKLFAHINTFLPNNSR